MPLYRHHALLLDRRQPTQGLVQTPTMRVVPLDTDSIPDSQQGWRAELRLAVDTPGAVGMRVQTSFDAEEWLDVFQGGVNAQTTRQSQFAVLPAFGPLLRVVVTPSPPAEPTIAPPRYRALVRLVSDAPFRLRPA